MTEPVLAIDALSVEFATRAGPVRVLRDLSFSVQPGETVALVGESGCGESMTALSIMSLLPRPAGRIVAGSIRVDGQELADAEQETFAPHQGRQNLHDLSGADDRAGPRLYRRHDQIAEVLRIHRKLPRRKAIQRAIDALAAVDIPDPARRLNQYPHELSGGMRQRVMIAMAIACEPELLIADEPTTALDVTVQAQIFDLLKDLRKSHRHGTDLEDSPTTWVQWQNSQTGQLLCTRAAPLKRRLSTVSCIDRFTPIRA